jgi:hypothetical protein
MFVVLIAVALFAALSYAMMRGTQGSQNMLTSEEANIIASEIVQYGDSLRPIIDKMLLLNGVLDTDSPAGSGILFDAPGSGVSPLTRELFDPTGGNAPYTPPPPQACLSTCAYTFTGQILVTGVGSGTNYDLSMILASVPLQVCQMINVVLGLGTPASTPPTDAALATIPFNGTNYGTSGITLAGAGITGNHAFCYQEASGGPYIYVNVIRSR